MQNICDTNIISPFPGTTEVITRDILAFGDSDDLDLNLNILLTAATSQGKLLLRNQQVKVGDAFTQADINSGYVRYGGELNAEMLGFVFVKETKLHTLYISCKNNLKKAKSLESIVCMGKIAALILLKL